MTKKLSAVAGNTCAKIDAKDKKIIEILKENSRMPIRDIAKSTGIRPSTVHKRMKELRNKGTIKKFTIKLDNAAVGEDFIVFMFVNTATDLQSSLFKNNHVKEAFGVTGEYDLLLKLKFSGINEFNDYIINLRKNKDILKTLTTIVTIPIKEDI